MAANPQYQLNASCHLQGYDETKKNYVFFVKWMLCFSDADLSNLRTTDISLPQTGDQYTLTFTDAATQTVIFTSADQNPNVIQPKDTALLTYKPFKPLDTLPIQSSVLVSDAIAEFGHLHRPNVIAGIAKKIAENTERLVPQETAGDDLSDAAAKFAAAIYKAVAKSYYGASAARDEMLRDGQSAFARDFNPSFSEFLARYKETLDTEEFSHLRMSLLNVIRFQIISDISSLVDKTRYLVMLGLSGSNTKTVSKLDARDIQDIGVGDAFGMEYVVPLPSIMITPGPNGDRFKAVTMQLSLHNPNVQDGSRDTSAAPVLDCLNKASNLRMLKEVDTPQGFYVEDGWFSDAAPTRSPRLGDPGTKAIFNPTCGDGIVQICIWPDDGDYGGPTKSAKQFNKFTPFTVFEVAVTTTGPAHAGDPPVNPITIGTYIPYAKPDSGNFVPLPDSKLPDGAPRPFSPREVQTQLLVDDKGQLQFRDPGRYAENPNARRPPYGVPFYFWSRGKMMNGVWGSWRLVKRRDPLGNTFGLHSDGPEDAITILAASPPPPPADTSAKPRLPEFVLNSLGGGNSYQASLKIPDFQLPNAVSTVPNSMPKYCNYYGIQQYHALLFAKIIEIALTPTVPGSRAISGAPLEYFQASTWFQAMIKQGWILADYQVAPVDGSGTTEIQFATVPPGFVYQPVIVAQRDPKNCYIVPASPSYKNQAGLNYFPAARLSPPGSEPARPLQLNTSDPNLVIPLRFDLSDHAVANVQSAPVIAQLKLSPILNRLEDVDA
jgi:hypothetical protein